MRRLGRGAATSYRAGVQCEHAGGKEWHEPSHSHSSHKEWQGVARSGKEWQGVARSWSGHSPATATAQPRAKCLPLLGEACRRAAASAAQVSLCGVTLDLALPVLLLWPRGRRVGLVLSSLFHATNLLLWQARSSRR